MMKNHRLAHGDAQHLVKRGPSLSKIILRIEYEPKVKGMKTFKVSGNLDAQRLAELSATFKRKIKAWGVGEDARSYLPVRPFAKAKDAPIDSGITKVS